MESIRVRGYDDAYVLASNRGETRLVFICEFDPVHHIRHKGRTFKFMFDSHSAALGYSGPIPLNALGHPVYPPKPKHPFWAAFAEWERRQLLRKKRKEKADVLQRASETDKIRLVDFESFAEDTETRRFMKWEKT